MSKTLKHEIKADGLIDKGMMLLWSKGYNATSVNDIVKEAGVPKGSFYFYFKSKEDFAIKSIEKYFQQQFGPAFELLDNKTISPKQRLLDLYELRSNILKEQFDCKMGCLGCNLANEMAEHSEAIRNAVHSKTEMIKSKIASVIEEAQNYGEISNTLPAIDLAAFMEDAGRGAMVSMKEMNSAYPIDNFMTIIRSVLLK